jgi:hypothetical protein
VNTILIVLYAVIGIAVLSTLAGGKYKLSIGIFWVIFLLGFGIRRFFLTSRLEFHPAEVLIWFLAGLVLLDRSQAVPTGARFRVPSWMIVFMLFWPIGWVLAYTSGTALEQSLNQFKPFLLLPVVFWLVWRLVMQKHGWQTLLASLFITGTLVAVTGLVEYILPGTTRNVPGFMDPYSSTIGVNSFMRAHYSFFGAPTATFMMVVTAPLGLSLWQWARVSWLKLLILAGVTLQAAGIYIGGYRSIWLAMSVQLIIFAVLNYGPILGVLVLVPAVFVYESLPREAMVRMASLFSAAEGNPLDSSAVKRIGRVEDAMARLKERPIGTGWSTSGWTHNDLLQIGLSVGAAGALVFILGYLWTAFRLIQQLLTVRQAKDHAGFRFGLGILLSFIGSGFLFVTQGITWQVFLVIPAWFSWAMATYWVFLPPASVRVEIKHEVQNFSPITHF